MPPSPLTATKAYYIKLGRGGEWESECLESGRLRIGFHEAPHALCLQCLATGDWSPVRKVFLGDREIAPSTAGNHANRIREFYEAGDDVLWITFSARKLWYGIASSGVVESTAPDSVTVHKERAIRWSSLDLGNTPLTFDRLSSKLTQLTSVQNTMCTLKKAQFDYLRAKISATPLPEIVTAAKARAALLDALIPLMANLHWRDFETLVDLTFAAGGWRRVSILGGTEKDIDLELEQPVTKERIAVQVKSACTADTIKAVGAIARRHAEHYKIFHLATNQLPKNPPVEAGLTLLAGRDLAELVLDAGLTDWLIRKSA